MPAPESNGLPSESRSEYTIAASICEVWKDIFGMEVGVDDNFFDLGGDSLMIIHAVGVSHEAGLAMTVGDVLENQTPRALAAKLAMESGGIPP